MQWRNTKGHNRILNGHGLDFVLGVIILLSIASVSNLV